MEKLSKRMTAMLVVQFFLGMLLNLIGEPQSDWSTWHKVVAYFFFIWHVANALGLIVVGYLLWQAAKGAPADLQTLVKRGYYSLLLAFAGGIGVVSLSSLGEAAPEIASFVMATGFLLAFIFYGKLYLKQQAAAK